MGLLDGALGNASKIHLNEIQQEISQILVPGEVVEHAYQLIRDFFVFTNKRFIMVDKQGFTGSKIEYHSIPYKSIIHFSIETAGTLDLDAELKIWLSGMPLPIQKQFNSRLNIYEVQTVLASHVLGQHSPSDATFSQTRSSKSAINSVDEEHDADESEDLEFCFHCGEVLKQRSSKCPNCNGKL